MTSGAKGTAGLACLLAAIGAFYLIGDAADRHAISFFSTALAREGIEETVLVAGTPYRVQNGQASLASGAPASERQTLQALRVAYAAAVAQHSPLFGMAGTDPDELERLSRALQEVAVGLAALQEAGPVVHDLTGALYPTAFLAALADTERARREFIETPSDDLSRKYDDALETVLKAYEKDLRAFIDAFERNVDEDMNYRVLSGVVTKQSFLEGTREALQQITRVQEAHRDRKACMRGRVDHCVIEDLALPKVGLSETAELSPSDTSTAEELLSIYKEALSRKTRFEGAVIALNGGACVPGMSDPQLYFLREKTDEETPYIGGSLWYIHNLFSYETEHFAQLLKDERVTPLTILRDAEVLFAHYKPTAYYLCPELGADISEARATLFAYAALDIPVASFTGGHPILQETVAREQVERVLEAFPTDRERYEKALEAAAMFAEHGGGLELLLEEVVLNQRSNILQYGAGLSPDMSAQSQFFAKSGFVSLYLLHHQTMGRSSISIFKERHRGPEDMRLLSWPALRDMLPREKIVRDLEVFFLMHIEPERAAEI